ncbi:MAG: HAD family hydrolase [Thermaerobacter sp.]|nr:HAD family hydrolase [Thermaerobacter sp.]
MNLELRQVAAGIFANSRAIMQAEVADVIVFDMDGVLINVHQSYPVVICKAVDAYLAEVGLDGDGSAVFPEETELFKAAGGFNSDWALAQGIALIYLVKTAMTGETRITRLRRAAPDLAAIARTASQYGGGLAGLSRGLESLVDGEELETIKEKWDRSRITRLAQEFYAGDASPAVFGVPNETVRGPGLLLQEHPLIDRAQLSDAPFRYALYTGRNRGEVETAFAMAKLQGIMDEEAIVTEDRGMRKPNPAGLFTIARALTPRLMIFAGDNLDDWQTAARYETERALDDPPCLFCGVLGGSPGALAYGLFQDRGVDLIASGSAALVEWVTSRRQHR